MDDNYAIDGTVMNYNNNLYFLLSGTVNGSRTQNIYIAKMSSPTSISTKKVLISTPTYSFEKQGIDTLQIARKVHTNLESKSLGALCEYYHITNQAAHRAYHDALATAKLYQCMAHYFEAQEENLFAPVQLSYKPKPVQPMTKKQVEYLRLLCKHHHLCFQEGYQTLSRSEASRKIDAIISEYGKIQY